MPDYTCSKCARVFKRKSGYDDHITKKNDCSQITALNQVIEKAAKAAVQGLNPLSEIILPEDKVQQEAILQKFFDDLHNLLWSRAGLNPERALEHMTFFFAYRLIETQADVLSLPQECRWSHIAIQKNENDTYDIMKKGCIAFQKNKITKPFFKKPDIDKADIIFDFIQQINRIPLRALSDMDTLGNIFEYMLGRGMSTMSDEGQYFTNRAICKIAFKLAYDIKKTLRRSDGSLCTFADWFCGTGGFPAEYIRGVKTHLPDVDWKRDFGSIYCQDMNLSSVTTTLLNILILTGIPFNGDKIRGSNSFTEPITRGSNAHFPGLEVDYCFMNPPYGGDKSKSKDYKFAYAKNVKGEDGKKTKKYFVNEDIQSIGIEDDDKVSAGVQLAMATMSSNGGICSIVLLQGFFFGASKKCIELRKKLATEYKIHYVVDIASGSFINTSTKTSMLVFQKGVGPTEKVSFIGLDEKLIIQASLKELEAKNYSLNYKQYLPQDAVEVDGIEMVKLGTIVSFNTKRSDRKKPYYHYIDIASVDHGKLNLGDVINNSDLPGRAQYSVNIGDILLSTVRPNLEHYLLISDTNFQNDLIVSNGFAIMTSDQQKVIPSYLYYLMTLPSTTKYLSERATGSAYPVVNVSIIGDIDIPLPSLERQQEIVKSIDTWSNSVRHEEILLNHLEAQMLFEVKELSRGHPHLKLKDVCTFQRGKPLSKKDFIVGDFPVIGGGTKPVGFHNAYNMDPYTILVSQSGTAGHISRYPTKIWASDCFSLNAKQNILPDFLYYSVLQISEDINFLKEGSAQPHVYPNTIENLEIPIPPLEIQQSLYPDFMEIRHKYEKIQEYNARTLLAIKRLIPGA